MRDTTVFGHPLAGQTQTQTRNVFGRRFTGLTILDAVNSSDGESENQDEKSWGGKCKSLLPGLQIHSADVNIVRQRPSRVEGESCLFAALREQFMKRPRCNCEDAPVVGFPQGAESREHAPDSEPLTISSKLLTTIPRSRRLPRLLIHTGRASFARWCDAGPGTGRPRSPARRVPP